MEGVLDGPALRRAMRIYAEALRSHRDEIDSLNVYPVPDGDTGTNLWLTQQAVVDALAALEDERTSLDETGEVVAQASREAARGNSGVIMSEILRGLVESWRGRDHAGPTEAAVALDHAARKAGRAVARPAEGTILTVARAAGRAALDRVRGHGQSGCGEVLAAALVDARAALAATKDILPEMRAANVVDAGAKGFVILLDALHSAVSGAPLSEPIGPFGPLGRATGSGTVDATFSLTASSPTFEVHYLAEIPDERVPSLRGSLEAIGDSVSVGGGRGRFTIHVHTGQPDRAVALGRTAGRITDVRVSDLGAQVRACTDASGPIRAAGQQ